MRTVIASSAILFVVSASGVPDRVETLARSLQTTVIDRVRSVYRDNGRNLQLDATCEEFEFEADEEGVSCTCSDENDRITLKCSIDDSLLPPPDETCGSITEAKIEMAISSEPFLSVSSKVCMTFDEDYTCDKGLVGSELCVGMGMTLAFDLSDLFGSDLEEGGVPTDGAGIVNDPDGSDMSDLDMSDFLKVTCNVSLTDHECTCGMCDNYVGIEVNCTEGDVVRHMDCTEGLSLIDPSSAFGDETEGVSLGIGGGDDADMAAFVIPRFTNNIAVTDSLDENENKDGDDEDKKDNTKDDGTDDKGDDTGDVGAVPAGSSGSFVQTTYSLIASAMVFAVMSAFG